MYFSYEILFMIITLSFLEKKVKVLLANGGYFVQVPLLLTWINFSPSMDK